MSDELRNAIIEAGERLPVGAGDVNRAIAVGRRSRRLRRASVTLLSVAFVGAGWVGATGLMGDDRPAIIIGGITSPTPSRIASAPGRLCPNDTEAGLIIDWSNFVQFDGITYQETYSEGRELPKDWLGEVYAEVECTIQDHVAQSDYEIQDGDAAFLEPGTKVYEVKGYDPSFRLATRWNGNFVIYEADTNPRADVGEDMLDIRGKVSSITVHSDVSEKLATFGDPDQVERLTEMVLSAPVDQEKNVPGDDNIFVTFNLKDGTSVVRAVSRGSDIMSRGIQLPPQFVDEIERAIPRPGEG